MKKTIASLIMLLGTFLLVSVALASSDTPVADEVAAPAAQAESEGCLSCHEGIEDIRDPESQMMKQIMAQGECTICHGGDPAITGDIDDAEAAASAHGPEGEFYPDPGSPWVADKTCGACHVDYNYALKLSLMNTEAGKIQGNLWAWGAQGDQTVRYGNYTTDDTDGATPLFGTDAYKAYMDVVVADYPDQFPSHLDMLPEPSVEEIIADPSLAAFTYQRNQCQRCHVGVPGRERRGDYRGMGCSSCHIPYSNNGFYEGNDPTTPTDEAGHMLLHSMQGTREARNGIPVETCNSCHNRGKRIGVSFEGIMEFPYGTPFNEEGGEQPKLHTKQYLYIKDDLHHDPISRDGNPEGGMLCQDCHTSIEMHGDGNIPGTTLAQVEIECTDCHGTPDEFPWELPLGYGEELLNQSYTEARDTVLQLPLNLSDGTVYDPEDGYLLTARGNPFGNVIRRGDEVVVHSATGRDYVVPILKSIKQAGSWKNADAEVAMDKVGAHMEEMECYSCHADWAPQCYGCHVTADYSNENADTDWVKIGNAQNPDGTVDTSLTTAGKISEGRSYLRWEEPILGVNGEGRVTPLIPGCQVIFTVIGPDGENVAHNMIGHTPPNTEGGGEDGQLGLDMAPAQPHTVGREARSCESCHADPKALGYGIGGGVFLLGYDEDRVIDLFDSEGNLIPANYSVQMPGIPDLSMDLSQIVDPETGAQLMTVGSHWPGSGPLSADQRTRMERVGSCMGCHQNMTDTEFWTDQVVATYGQIVTNDDHVAVMNQLVYDAVEGQAAVDDAAIAQAEAEALQGQLDETNAALAEAEAAADTAGEAALDDEAPVAAEDGGSNMLYPILALVVGALVGAGGFTMLRKK